MHLGTLIIPSDGSFIGVGSVGYDFLSVEVEHGNIKNLTILDHGKVERYYTVSAFARAVKLSEEEVFYFISRFFEWKRLNKVKKN